MAGNAKFMPTSFIYATLAVGNLATGGSIGTAATTVDLYGHITINQTTAGQNDTFPTPTITNVGRFLVISNIGTQSINLTSTGVAIAVFAIGTSAVFFWTGAAWSKVV